jgi:hypothetical protein
MGARVEITTTDGRTVEATVDHPAGFAGKPLAETRAVARKKCRTGLEAAGDNESTARRKADDLFAIQSSSAVSLDGLLPVEMTA